MEQKISFVKCLLHLYEFEIYWAYFCLSDGGLYAGSSRRAAGSLGSSLKELLKSGILTTNPLFTESKPSVNPDDIADLFLAWQDESNNTAAEEIRNQAFPIHTFFLSLKKLLYEQLGINLPVTKGPDGSEMMYRASFVRWQGHFPTALLMNMSYANEILEKANSSNTIAVIGDIRRSQDLMTYAKDGTSFASNMVRFIEGTRRRIDENLGIFDKFTGDGFLAYFNESLCAMRGADFRDCFLNFVHLENEFAANLFDEWRQTVRRLPDEPVGLSIGADVGRISFLDMNFHFMAVGDPIVWASRMADAGKAGEIVVNNLLYQEIKNYRSDIGFKQREGKTKAGEPFLIWLAQTKGITEI